VNTHGFLRRVGLGQAGDLVRRGRWEVRTLAGRFPRLYLPVVRARYRPGQFQIPFQPDTELVIDGFLRSGTTFVFTAFEHAQPQKVAVAHHVHAPAQILAAVREGIPALVLVREPEDAVLSLIVRLPYLSAAQGLRAYVRFYEPLLRHRRDVVVGTFSEATGDVGGLIRRVNARFGTLFRPFAHTEEDERAVFALIDEGDHREFGQGDAFERAVGRPSPVRERMKEKRRAEYRSPRLARMRARADRVYRAFSAAVGPSPDPPRPGTA
jgi:hypothetical protein